MESNSNPNDITNARKNGHHEDIGSPSSSPLIDPALLQNLNESERAEALAAAAQRAEQRAEQRAKDGERLTEQHALAKAEEQRCRERERERALEKERMAKVASLKLANIMGGDDENDAGFVGTGGIMGNVVAERGSGLVFVSKKRRAEKIPSGNGGSSNSGPLSSYGFIKT